MPSKNRVINIGFDDTDSPKGMCTTFLAFKIVDVLKKEKVEFLDLPRLVRFNPNIPWKTRGNGAVSMKISTRNPKSIKQKITNLIKRYSDVKNGANPGLVFYESLNIPKSFHKFSEAALWRLINKNYAKKFAIQSNIETFYLGNGQGLVGAIGSIGYPFGDSTVELLTYRKQSMFGKKREISLASVKKMQDNNQNTFNSYDTLHDKILIAPHGPDPVFYGIRGEDIKSLYQASKLIKFTEKLDGHVIFRSNQGTDDHLKNKINPREFLPYTSGVISGVVSVSPKSSLGGHVFFSILCNDVIISCIVYKPTGLGKIARELILGDVVEIGGGVRKSSKIHPRSLNVEFINILKLEPKLISVNPSCIHCHKNMKSKGKGQGYCCIKCKNQIKEKQIKKIPRDIQKTRYIPQVSAHRHLSRPLYRVGKYNKSQPFDDSVPWFKVYK